MYKIKNTILRFPRDYKRFILIFIISEIIFNNLIEFLILNLFDFQWSKIRRWSNLSDLSILVRFLREHISNLADRHRNFYT